MKRFVGGLLGAFFDLRIVIGVCGILLSIVMHELFHLILHWGEITTIHLLPNPATVVEILFVPTFSYNLLAEEVCAYGITALTITLTAMLIHDINDQRDHRSVEQIILAKESDTKATRDRQLHQLRMALGINSTSTTTKL